MALPRPVQRERRAPGLLELPTSRVDDLLSGQEALLLRPALGQLRGERGSVTSKLLEADRDRGCLAVEPLNLGLQGARARGQPVDPCADVVERRAQALGLALVSNEGTLQGIGLDPARRHLLCDAPSLLLGIPPRALGAEERRLHGLELALLGGEGRSDLFERALRSLELLLQGE